MPTREQRSQGSVPGRARRSSHTPFSRPRVPATPFAYPGPGKRGHHSHRTNHAIAAAPKPADSAERRSAGHEARMPLCPRSASVPGRVPRPRGFDHRAQQVGAGHDPHEAVTVNNGQSPNRVPVKESSRRRDRVARRRNYSGFAHDLGNGDAAGPLASTGHPLLIPEHLPPPDPLSRDQTPHEIRPGDDPGDYPVTQDGQAADLVRQHQSRGGQERRTGIHGHRGWCHHVRDRRRANLTRCRFRPSLVHTYLALDSQTGMVMQGAIKVSSR